MFGVVLEGIVPGFGDNPHEDVGPKHALFVRCSVELVLTVLGHDYEVEGEPLLIGVRSHFKDVVIELHTDDIGIFEFLFVTQFVV